MTKTLFRGVYLDGVHLAPGTELTDEQAKRITNPNATKDRSVKGQDGKPAEGEDAAPPAGPGDGDSPGRRVTTSKATR